MRSPSLHARSLVCLGLASLLLAAGVVTASAQNVVFTPTAANPVGRSPQSIASADFNGDGWLDVATANSTSDDVSVLISNGNGTFSSAVSFGVGKIPMAIAAADVDADNHVDLLVATSGADHIVVLKGTGTGRFEEAGRYASGSGTTFLALQDVDGDRDVDIVAANSGRFGYYPPFSVSVLLNRGTGQFHDAVLYESEDRDGMFPTGVSVADFTGDGHPDLAVTWSQPSWRTPAGLISVLVNQGKGRFAVQRDVQAGKTLSALTSADLNGDGRLDLVAASVFSDSVIVLLQDDTGGFVNRGAIHVGFNPVAVTLSDVNGDAELDLVVSNRDSSSVTVLLAHGVATFHPAGNFGVGGAPSSLVVADFDRDALPDIVTADSNSDALSVLLSGGGAIPLVSLSSDALTFNTSKTANAREHVVRVTNIGLGQLAVGHVELSGKDSSAFAVTSDRCEGTTLATGESCRLSVAFTAEKAGTYTALMRVYDNGGGSPRLVTLKGLSNG